MALAKERAMRNPQPGFVQARGSPPIQGFDPSSLEFYGFKGNHASMMLEDGGCSNTPGTYPIGHLPPLSNPSNSSSSNVFVFGAVNSTLQGSMPVISFNAAAADNWAYSSSSVLSFDGGDRAYSSGYPKLDHEEECASWIDGIDHEYQLNHLSLKSVTDSRLAQDDNCFEIANGFGMASNVMKDNRHGDEQFGLIFSDAAVVDSLQEGGGQESCSQKRPYKGDDAQDPKIHCGNGRKAKAKPSQTKDPQSVAAKNRRERISERLKTLQELVPNGTKVDLVTMLEKAISYVKFLQLQVKVLATDEFWPAQGGKAPEVAQVKEAIDAILASHKR